MFFYINLILTHSYYIKVANKDLYLQGPEPSQGLPFPGERSTANKYTFKFAAESPSHRIISVTEQPGYVFDISGSVTDLIFYPETGHANQQYELVPIDLVRYYLIVQDNKCLKWDATAKKYAKSDCTPDLQNPDQLFELICVDCESRRKNLPANLPPVVDAKPKPSFLNDDTVNVIRDIAKMALDLSDCYSKNGTCLSLDNNHLKLFCVSEYDKPDEVPVEQWPDLRLGMHHVEDLPKKPLGFEGADDEVWHVKTLQDEAMTQHLDLEHRAKSYVPSNDLYNGLIVNHSNNGNNNVVQPSALANVLHNLEALGQVMPDLTRQVEINHNIDMGDPILGVRV